MSTGTAFSRKATFSVFRATAALEPLEHVDEGDHLAIGEAIAEAIGEAVLRARRAVWTSWHVVAHLNSKSPSMRRRRAMSSRREITDCFTSSGAAATEHDGNASSRAATFSRA